MSDPPTITIVGAGLAGATAAQTLRAEGYDGRIVLLGSELHRPYERPPLSKGYLQGSTDREKVFVHPPQLVRRARRRPPARQHRHRARPDAHTNS